VYFQRLGDDVAHAHARAERAVRVLEHYLDRASVAHQRIALQFQNIVALKADAAFGWLLLKQD
jgi:hypothetical protein